MSHHYSPVLGAGGDIDGSLQEPTMPLNYLTVPKVSEGYANLWGEHQNVSEDGYFVTIRVDRSSGSGFKSKETYMYGFFNDVVKLQAGYTVGIIT
ncbi:hypothetical protein SUGI_0961680 [Cryptomeria japonica]|nr:hypothetical protein SUGI_0961680 [Cryptomeria japonica]